MGAVVLEFVAKRSFAAADFVIRKTAFAIVAKTGAGNRYSDYLLGCWCPEEDSNLHALSSAAT